MVAGCVRTNAFEAYIFDFFHDSPPPKKTAVFFNETNVSWLLDTRKDAVEKKSIPCIFLRAKV